MLCRCSTVITERQMARDENLTPWDIYVDEVKVPGDYRLGFLVIPNTASFSQKLFRCRQHPPGKDGRTVESRELHWSRLHRGVAQVALDWIDLVFQHRGAKFYLAPWAEKEPKELVILRFIARSCQIKRLVPPYNMVVFLDYDSEHAPARIQNTIREVGNISRCYHLDSKKNDCIQCCDLLLGALRTLGNDESIPLDFDMLDRRHRDREKLRDSEIKRYIAGYLGRRIDADSHCVYDLRRGKLR